MTTFSFKGTVISLNDTTFFVKISGWMFFYFLIVGKETLFFSAQIALGAEDIRMSVRIGTFIFACA